MTAVGVALPKPPMRDPAELLLPFNLEAERSTLGAAILYTDAADFITDKLTPDDFHRRAHAAIFETIRDLRHDGVEVDYVTIKEKLGSKLDDVGGPAYIASLTDGVPRATNVRYYCDILRDLHAKRSLITFASLTLDHAVAGEHTAAELIADADRRLIELQAGHVDGRMVSIRSSGHRLLADLEYRAEHRGELLGLTTGYDSINELTLGWQASDLIIVAARPSMGKTSLVMNMATHVARAGKHVAIFSLEMRRKQLENRLLASLSGVALSRIMSGHLGAADYTALSESICELETLNISIDDRASQTIWDMRGACRRMKSEGKLDLVVIDYVQLIPGTLGRKGASRNDELTDISRRAKILADEITAPVILLSQLNRAMKGRQDRTPQLEDLKDCGALEQDADVVAFLHRKHHQESGTTKFIVRKARNGPTGTVNLTFEGDCVRFSDGGEDEPDEAPKPRKKKSTQPALPDVDDGHTSE